MFLRIQVLEPSSVLTASRFRKYIGKKPQEQPRGAYKNVDAVTAVADRTVAPAMRTVASIRTMDSRETRQDQMYISLFAEH